MGATSCRRFMACGVWADSRAVSLEPSLPIPCFPIEVHFGAVLVMSLLIIAIGFRYLVDDATAKAEEEDVPKFSFKTIDPILFLLGLMGFAGMFCEGTVYDWSGVYFSSVVKPDEAFIRAGYVAGMGAMTLGRFLADGFVTKSAQPGC